MCGISHVQGGGGGGVAINLVLGDEWYKGGSYNPCPGGVGVVYVMSGGGGGGGGVCYKS